MSWTESSTETLPAEPMHSRSLMASAVLNAQQLPQPAWSRTRAMDGHFSAMGWCRQSKDCGSAAIRRSVV
jgi:hypothetical protein